MAAKRVLTFDMDGVICRPPFGMNPGRNRTKPRKTAGKPNLLAATESWRYRGRRPMAGAKEGFLALAQRYDCHLVTARTERARGVTERWLETLYGYVPPLHLRPGYQVTPAAWKVRLTGELGALAHFEDDPHTALWVAETVPLVFLVDWWRNRWLDDPAVHRIRRIGEAAPILDAQAPAE